MTYATLYVRVDAYWIEDNDRQLFLRNLEKY